MWFEGNQQQETMKQMLLSQAQVMRTLVCSFSKYFGRFLGIYFVLTTRVNAKTV